ncbi:hypothetical protein PG984_009136 [Apiospora sp. TS-2023a]
MADSIPGRPASSEPPCYNCGMRGHLFTACPEPTRELPAGLEASRARQHTSGSDRGDFDRRHKGPIVTRYSHPSSQSPIVAPYPPPPPQPYSYGPPHSSPSYPPQPPPPAHYPPSSYGQGYPPPPRPAYDGYNAPGTTGPPHGSHPSYGPPSYGQAAPPHHGYGPPPPGVRPGLGHPADYRAGPMHPHAPAPGYPPPPPTYGFPGQSQSPPFGPPGLPVPPPHGHPLPPPPPPQPIHYSPDHRGFPGPIPPPGFPVYPPGYPPPQHEEPYSPYPNRRRENHRDERYAKHERGGRRGGRHNDRDRERHGYERDRPHHEHSYDRDHRGRGDRHGPKRRLHDRNTEQSPRGGRFHQLPPSRPESVQSKNRLSTSLSRQDSHLTSAQSTPGHSGGTLDNSQLSSQLEDVTSNENAAVDAITVETKAATESDTGAAPDANIEDRLKAHAQVKDPSVEPQVNTEDPQGHDISQQPTDEDGDTPYEGFRYDEQTIFKEIETTNKGDPIAEPLPIEWTDDIMLPPPYNAPGVKSTYVTPENKDDFALGVRDTDQWAQYKHHIAFLDPENITVSCIDTYLAEVKKLQHKNEKRNKPGQHANQRPKPQSRDHPQSQRNLKDQHRRPDNRKRRFDDYQGELGAELPGRDQTVDLANAQHDYEAKRPKQMSPEPGEVSDSGSVQGVIGGVKPAAEENSWTGWTRGPADILPRDYSLPGRPTPAETPWYPDANVHYQAQPPSRRYHAEETLDGSYDGRQDYRTDSYTPRAHTRDYDSHDRFRDGSEGRRESRGRSRSPGTGRYFSDRQHSPLSAARHIDVSSSQVERTPDSKPRRRNESVVSSTRLEGNSREVQAASSSLQSSEKIHRQGSPRPRVGRPRSRQSSIGDVSGPESPGSPLTPLEAELLGLAGHDSSDSDSGGRSPQRKPEKLVPKMRRRRAQVDAAYSIYSRRW